LPRRLIDAAQHDTLLPPEITRVWNANQQVYGAVKVWKQL